MRGMDEERRVPPRQERVASPFFSPHGEVGKWGLGELEEHAPKNQSDDSTAAGISW